FVLYFICYLDRVNIGFASLTMNEDLGLSSYMFGLGAGAFFWGYFILEVPSNLILDRVGARRWIARIMVTWGLVSGAFAFIGGPVRFFILRFLLGLAEAGFFPGMILYFTYSFPPSHRARIVAGFMAATPVSIGLGTPVSTSLLDLDGVLGIAGWRWLFLREATPAVIFGIATFLDVIGSFSGGLYALAAFGPMAAIVAAVCVRETPVAVVPRALEATGD